MKGKTIKQKFFIKAEPQEVYECIIDPKKHSEFTGAKATGKQEKGAKFTAYDGYIFGQTMKLEKGKKIVQKWGCSDFPEGYFTEVVFQFKKEKEGTRIIFTQKNVPEGEFDNISRGWFEFYWEPLKKFVESK